MIDGKKIIGVCMTKIQDGPRSRTISYLHKEAEKNGYKLIVFNSIYDFYHGLDNEIGAAKLYNFINYDIVDALIIMCSGYMDKAVYEEIIKKALANNVPVILEDYEAEGCFTVRNSFDKALSELMNHVIRDHGRRDTFFLTGVRENIYSKFRTEVYKSVLKENDLPFDEETMLDYGDFWETPAREAIGRLLNSGRKLPNAIFCANDAMAIATCKLLMENGIRVPEDVIVTGLDGSMMAEFYRPKISTCVIDHKGFAQKCIEVIYNIFNGIDNEQVIFNPYTVRLAESCGCHILEDGDFRELAEFYHRQSTDMLGHEHVVYNKILIMMNSMNVDVSTFYSAISKVMGYNSVLAFRPSFLTDALAGAANLDVEDEELVLINPEINPDKNLNSAARFSSKDMVPDLHSWVQNEKTLYVISSVQVGQNICGYYAEKTDNILRDAHMMNRAQNLANMITHIAISDMRQRFLKIKKSEDTLIDPLTELPNLHSLTSWYESFVLDEANDDKAFTISVYDLPKYRYIYEKYGIQAVETAMCFVAEALRIANPQNCFIANTAENEFIIINYFDDKKTALGIIEHSITVFRGVLDSYNLKNDNEFFVEVNIGYSMINKKKGKKLEKWIHTAIDEMVKNASTEGELPVEKWDHSSAREQYGLFNTLISQNLFRYYFQPIICAKTGDIIAYEALMRTDERIGFNPLEVLEIARTYRRLYDVEKATLFNVMHRYSKEREKIKDRKVFINCIPGHFLNDADNERFTEQYSEYVDNFVFEITEQDSITDSDLLKIRNIGNKKSNNVIAVDDYGTGHSNLVNLLKYAPEIVKIDRYLITDIAEDTNKQLLVKGVIDFARVNGIKVLAEGVETKEELEEVISLGVDYIQGYYTGRPAFEPLDMINPQIKEEIAKANA